MTPMAALRPGHRACTGGAPRVRRPASPRRIAHRWHAAGLPPPIRPGACARADACPSSRPAAPSTFPAHDFVHSPAARSHQARLVVAPRRLPDPEPTGEGSPARLPRQRRLRPAAGAGHRGDHPLLRARPRQRPPRHSRAQPPLDHRLRGRARPRRRVLQREAPRGDRLHPRRHRGVQPPRPRLGRRQRARGRHHPAHRDGASQQSGAVADARRAQEGQARLRPRPRPRGQTRCRRARSPAHARREALLVHPRLERLRLRQPRHRSLPSGACQGHHHDHRRRAERRPPAGRCAGAWVRLPRLLRPQDARAHRQRHPLRTVRPARGDAAVPRRW